MHVVGLHMLQDYAAEEIARIRAIDQRWEYYDGKFPDPLGAPRAGKANDNVVVNFAKVIVNTGVSFLFGQPPSFDLDPNDETDDERWLRSAWEANAHDALLHELGMNGAIGGNAVVRLLEPDPENGQEYPRVVAVDPKIIVIHTDPFDIKQPNYFRLEFPWIDVSGPKPRPMILRQVIQRQGRVWTIQDFEQSLERRVFTDWRERGPAVLWNYPFPPVAYCQNLVVPNSVWGASDLEDDVIGLNKTLNYILSNLNRISRLHANPRTWGRGFAASELRPHADETIVLNSPDAALQNLEMFSDAGLTLGLYQRCKEALHQIAAVPETAIGKVDDLGQLSGAAIEILFQSLVQKTRQKRATYGQLLRDISYRMLVLGGREPGVRPVVQWPEIVPGDPKAVAEVSLYHYQLGVSQDTLMRRLGYDPRIEYEKRVKEAANAPEAAPNVLPPQLAGNLNAPSARKQTRRIERDDDPELKREKDGFKTNPTNR